MKKTLFALTLAMLAMGLSGCGSDAPSWSMALHGTVVEISYKQGNEFPQYAALHLESSYLRLNYGPDSAWGTSVILMPSFWADGAYHQGTPITVHDKTDGDNLILTIEGSLSGIHSSGEIRLSPPDGNSIHAHVSMSATGDVNLDNRPGEAFKPVMLSSMDISASIWDAQSAYIDAQSFPLPENGWIVTPPSSGSVFGLKGGTSDWKTNAPTVEITFAEPQTITGWVTSSGDSNDDNVGLWAASDQVLASWQYDIIARQSD